MSENELSDTTHEKPGIPTAIGRVDAIVDAIRSQDWALVETLTEAELDRQKRLAHQVNRDWTSRLDKLIEVQNFRWALLHHHNPEAWRAKVIEEANR